MTTAIQQPLLLSWIWHTRIPMVQIWLRAPGELDTPELEPWLYMQHTCLDMCVSLEGETVYKVDQ